jgi:hypothetical protein
MSTFTNGIAIYAAIVATSLLYRQVRHQRRKLIGLMVTSASVNTIADLADRGDCTKFRAWAFLIGLRIRRCIKSTPLSERDFIHVYGYKLNRKGRTKYQLIT